MPHDVHHTELHRGDHVKIGKRIGRIVAIDPEVCLCTIDLRGDVMVTPANRLEKVATAAEAAVA